MNIKNKWINRLIEGETQKVEMLVSITPQEVVDKLCLWGKSQGGIGDVCSVCLENGQEVLTAVFSKGYVTMLVVTKAEEEATKIYLSGSMSGAYFPLSYNKIKKYLQEVIQLLESVTLTVEQK